MANNIRLTAGQHRAIDTLTVSLMHSGEQKEYRVVKAGDTFEVPEHVNRYWSAVTYYPEFGDPEDGPRFEKVS